MKLRVSQEYAVNSRHNMCRKCCALIGRHTPDSFPHWSTQTTSNSGWLDPITKVLVSFSSPAGVPSWCHGEMSWHDSAIRSRENNVIITCHTFAQNATSQGEQLSKLILHKDLALLDCLINLPCLDVLGCFHALIFKQNIFWENIHICLNFNMWLWTLVHGLGD